MSLFLCIPLLCLLFIISWVLFVISLFQKVYWKYFPDCIQKELQIVYLWLTGKNKRPRKIINTFSLKILVMDMEVFSRLDSKGIEHFNRKLYLQVCFQFVDPMSKMTPIIVSNLLASYTRTDVIVLDSSKDILSHWEILCNGTFLNKPLCLSWHLICTPVSADPPVPYVGRGKLYYQPSVGIKSWF